ncbi:hypothetical protein SAMN03159341_101573 [Paenibacillus sp. 1_12]|uniref:hypothetical protein n=1 Tax=Paenibacillus sp. 1_12 TaxID=1566278 RepID=UPI0008DF2C7E|nr:hypothetical protein [Paenibacillus sp. 1_12]SFK78781.1 hypothetical protein SAMN03159341_101573 [Paenibacillus sp. 1_12]
MTNKSSMLIVVLCLLLMTGCSLGKAKSGGSYQKNTAVLLKAIYSIDFSFSKVVGKNDSGFDILEFYPDMNPDLKFEYQSFVSENYPKAGDKYDYKQNFIEVLVIQKYADVYSKHLGKNVNALSIREKYRTVDYRKVRFTDFFKTTDYVITISEPNIQEMSHKMNAMLEEIAKFPELKRYGGGPIRTMAYRFDNQKDMKAAYYLSENVFHSAYGQLEEAITKDITQRYQYMKETGELNS